MQSRKLGETGVEVSVLGFGGFHLLEIPSADASRLLGTYLDRGGSYVETAASYGNGISERKIGAAVSHRREEYTLATKTTERTKSGYLREIDRSLKNLKTDRLDIAFMHAVQNVEASEKILAPGGALEGAMEAKKAGKIRFIGITGHGQPDALIAAVRAYRYDVLMTGFNYFDRFNFPTIEGELLPLCRDRGTGVLAMKAFGDGYLYRSAAPALRYALSLPVASVVAGMNTDQMLESNLALVDSFVPMSQEELSELYRTAPELGDYVCRLCDSCNGSGFDPQSVFLLEGMFDRQMDAERVTDTALYALQERLKFWFDQRDRARTEYAALRVKVDPERDYRELNRSCPYQIDIDRKLKIAHGKLSSDGYIY
ncbi:MAG TPA: aldo/keto reductase [Spirochaetia bacterium]|nr:aldo/keto reductase [Spirochaetia bacterium]